MEKIKLANHIKRGDTFHTPFTDPNGLGASFTLSSWSKNSLPEYLWIGLIISKIGRKKGFEQLFRIMEELNTNDICIPQLSKISCLPEEKRKKYWDIVFSCVGVEELSSLTVIITPDIDEYLYCKCFDYSNCVEDNLSELVELIKQCSGFHYELTTDICFIVDWFYVKSGRLKLSSELDLLPEALTQYYNHGHEDEIMKMYCPMIRSTFQGVSMMDIDGKWSEKIWTRLGELSECTPFYIEWENKWNMDFYNDAKSVIEYFSSTNEDKKLSSKYSVIMGISCYIFKLYSDITRKELYNDLSGRIVFRAMIDAYINLKYLMLQEVTVDDVYDRFKAYGIGKYKLVMAKLREGKYNIPDDAQIEEKLMELLVNEETNEMFVEMSMGYFDKTKIRDKFFECNEQLLYEIYYEYGTSYSHGFWGAMRESSMLKCDNPSHDYHSVPDYDGKQKLKSIDADCIMLMKKLFSQIGTYIDLPDFYLEKYPT